MGILSFLCGGSTCIYKSIDGFILYLLEYPIFLGVERESEAKFILTLKNRKVKVFYILVTVN